MNKKATGIVAYCTIFGWIVAYLAGDKEGAKFHLNQGLVVCLLGIVGGIVGTILGFIPFIGWIFSLLISLVVITCMVVGILAACSDQEKEIPIICTIQLLK